MQLKKRILLLVGLLVVQLVFALCAAQNISRNASAADSVPFGLKPQEWYKMQEIWARRYDPVKVLLPNGNLLEGQILYLHNDKLVLHYEGRTFINQYVSGNEIISLHRDSLVNISYSPELTQRLMGSGLFWGTTAGIAAGVGLFFAGGGWIHPVIIAIPTLAGAGIGGYIDFKNNSKATEPLFLDLNSEKARERYVLFPDHLPGLKDKGEQLPVFTPERLSSVNYDKLLNASPMTRKLLGTTTISISGHAGMTSIEKDHSNFNMNVGFSFTYRPLTRLKIGYLYQQVMTLGEPFYEYTDYGSNLYYHQHAWIVSHTLLVKYVPLTASPFLTNRFEASVGIGPSLNKLYHQSYIRHNELWEVLIADESTIRKMGLSFMSDLDYYVFRNLSVYLSLNKTISKPFKPKDLTSVDPLTNRDILFETMEVYPSPIDILIGLRIHLLRR